MSTVGIIITITSAIVGTGGLAALLKVALDYRKEPAERSSVEATTTHMAVQSLELSHEALHRDMRWLRDELTATNTRLNETSRQLEETKTEHSRTRQELHRLRTAWERWWDDLLIGWHDYRQHDRPPPRPDRDRN